MALRRWEVTLMLVLRVEYVGSSPDELAVELVRLANLTGAKVLAQPEGSSVHMMANPNGDHRAVHREWVNADARTRR
jgi:hypothetical protein